MTGIEEIKREVFEFILNYEGDLLTTDLIDYLHSRGYLGGAPDGYVLVPKEPTDEMLNAPSTIIQTYGAGLIWQRMIAATPKLETK